MTLIYARNKHASTTDMDDGSILVRVTLEDTFFAGAAEMIVRVPDLEIASLSGQIKRSFNVECQEAVPLLQKAVGLRIAPGLIKSVSGLIAGPVGCPKMADLVLECCDEIVLRFTLDPVRNIQSKSGQERTEAGREFLRQNPGLVGTCIAYSKGSPLLEWFEV